MYSEFWVNGEKPFPPPSINLGKNSINCSLPECINAPNALIPKLKMWPPINTNAPTSHPTYGIPITSPVIIFTTMPIIPVVKPSANKREYDKTSEKYPTMSYNPKTPNGKPKKKFLDIEALASINPIAKPSVDHLNIGARPAGNNPIELPANTNSESIVKIHNPEVNSPSLV